MNPAHSHDSPSLHIVPKSAFLRLPVRQLTPQQGIQWNIIGETFERFGWNIQDQTDLFIKATHAQVDHPIIVSKISKTTILINHNFNTYIASALHEIEAILDVDALPKQSQSSPRHILLHLLMSLLFFV